MKTICTLSLLIALSISSVFAEGIGRYKEGTSYFDLLGQMFHEGGTPLEESLANVLWTARCFALNDPNKAYGAAFYFKEQDSGPLGKHFKVYLVDFVKDSSHQAELWDAKDMNQFMKERGGKLNLRSLKVLDNSLYFFSYFMEERGRFSGMKYQSYANFRQVGDYIVAEFSQYANRIISPDEIKGTVAERCYLFK